MTIGVVQWATGGVGRAAIEGILAHPELQLAGCWVHGEDKDGIDVGTLVGRDPLGVTATRDVDALLATGADCVLYAPLIEDGNELRRILSEGIDVVTPVGHFYPSPSQRVELDDLCKASGSTLHGTGIHPGGITERLPLTISAMSSDITFVRAEEFSDIRSYGAPDVIRQWMLFGATPEEASKSVMLDALSAGFVQSVWMIADTLGFELDRPIERRHEMAVATAPIESPIGPIERGRVAAQRFRWTGKVDGEPVITAAVNWLMGEEHLDPAWELGGERFEIEIVGDPSIRTTIEGLQPDDFVAGQARNPGIVGTANHCVNAIPYVVAADAGVVTYLDLPLVAGRGRT